MRTTLPVSADHSAIRTTLRHRKQLVVLALTRGRWLAAKPRTDLLRYGPALNVSASPRPSMMALLPTTCARHAHPQQNTARKEESQPAAYVDAVRDHLELAAHEHGREPGRELGRERRQVLRALRSRTLASVAFTRVTRSSSKAPEKAYVDPAPALSRLLARALPPDDVGVALGHERAEVALRGGGHQALDVFACQSESHGCCLCVSCLERKESEGPPALWRCWLLPAPSPDRGARYFESKLASCFLAPARAAPRAVRRAPSLARELPPERVGQGASAHVGGRPLARKRRHRVGNPCVHASTECSADPRWPELVQDDTRCPLLVLAYTHPPW